MDNCEPLEINTKGICLLCFNSSSSVTKRAASHYGFKQLLRYLQVNTKTLFNCSTQFLQTMQIGEDIHVQITLCTECSAVTEKFDKLYHEYELIRLQFDNCVHTLHQSMKNGEESPQLLKRYVDNMRPHKTTDLVNASIASNLRSETFKKCEQMLQSRPRIILEKPTLLTSHPLSIPPKGPSTCPDMDLTMADSDDDNDIDNHEANEFEVDDKHLSTSSDSEEDDILENDNTKTSKISTCELCWQEFEGSSHQSHRDHWVKYHYDHLIAYRLPKDTCVESCKQFGSALINQMLSNGSCHHCNQKVTDKFQLLVHLMSTHEEDFASQVQAQIIQSKEPFASPSPSVEGEAETKSSQEWFKCSQCSKTFDRLKMFNRHKLTHVQQYNCDLCKFVSGYAASVKAHKLEKHTVELVMPHFGVEIRKKHVEDAVTQVCSNYSEYKTQCPKCQLSFTNSSTPKIRRHILQMHFEEFVEDVKKQMKTKGTLDQEDDEPMDVVNSVQLKHEANDNGLHL